jgi:hypothetical protein
MGQYPATPAVFMEACFPYSYFFFPFYAAQRVRPIFWPSLIIGTANVTAYAG